MMQEIWRAHGNQIDIIVFQHFVVVFIGVLNVPSLRNFFQIVYGRHCYQFDLVITAVAVAVKIRGKFRTNNPDSDFVHLHSSRQRRMPG